MWRCFLLLIALGLQARTLPLLEVTRDDTVVTQSCRIVLPQGRVIPDANTNRILNIAADSIKVEFAPGNELRGAPIATAWDTLRGVGIRIEGDHGVTLKRARVHVFLNRLVATRPDRLKIEFRRTSEKANSYQ